MKVENMESKKTGKPIPNQFIITHKYLDIDYEECTDIYFQSYESTIVKKATIYYPISEVIETKIYLDKNYWDYSRTTRKYRNQFLNETSAETKAKIKDGTYILCDLNRR